MKSICDHLLNEIEDHQRKLRRIKFIWVERDPTFMEQSDLLLRRVSSTIQKDVSTNDLTTATSMEDTDDGTLMENATHAERLSVQLLNLPSSVMVDDTVISSDDMLLDESVVRNVSTPVLEATDVEDSDNGVARLNDDDDDVLDMEIYLTSGNQPHLIDISNMTKNHNIRLGRPNLSEIFLAMKRDVIRSTTSTTEEFNDGAHQCNAGVGVVHHCEPYPYRVAVCVSAPASLITQCRKACMIYSDSTIQFDFHSESMVI
jgi:Ferric reductase NAD binding domain